MIQIGTAEYQGPASSATSASAGAVFSAEPLECPDCGHSVHAHTTAGCYITDQDDNPLCLCRMSPDDIGETTETPEGANP